jgi:cytochrome b subunit of formate dehydrogenase
LRNITSQDLVKRTIYWLLLVVTIVFLISGFGITEFRTVETLTLGLLTKDLAFKIHDSLWIPFIILLILHLCLPLIFKWKTKREIGSSRP